MKKLLFLALFIPCFLFCEALRVINDSQTPLNATLYLQEKVMFSVILLPGQSYAWSDSQYATTSEIRGPFSITFTCKSGKTWGTIGNANWGFTYNANAATGPRSCR